MSDFKKCLEGHFYRPELEDCPYCNGQNIESELENLPEKPRAFPDIEAMCYIMGPKDY